MLRYIHQEIPWRSHGDIVLSDCYYVSFLLSSKTKMWHCAFACANSSSLIMTRDAENLNSHISVLVYGGPPQSHPIPFTISFNHFWAWIIEGPRTVSILHGTKKYVWFSKSFVPDNVTVTLLMGPTSKNMQCIV